MSHVSQLGSLSVEGLELFECFHRYTVDTVLGPHPHLVASGSLPLSNLDGHMKDLPRSRGRILRFGIVKFIYIKFL